MLYIYYDTIIISLYKKYTLTNIILVGDIMSQFFQLLNCREFIVVSLIKTLKN